MKRKAQEAPNARIAAIGVPMMPKPRACTSSHIQPTKLTAAQMTLAMNQARLLGKKVWPLMVRKSAGIVIAAAVRGINGAAA